jgi:hypothetical protein
MKILKLILLSFIIVISFNINLFSQVSYEAAIKNIKVVTADTDYGNCVYFDIYLRQNGGPGPLFLADADFKFIFNAANFTNPTINFVQGSSQLYNSPGAITTSYDASIVTQFLSPNELVISVIPPGFSTQSEFDTRVAKIDGTPDKHRLGTFVVYTFANISGLSGATWKTGKGGTVVTSFATNEPWISSPAAGTLK